MSISFREPAILGKERWDNPLPEAGILAKIELRIHFNGKSDFSLKRIIPEPRVPSRGSQARGTRLDLCLSVH